MLQILPCTVIRIEWAKSRNFINSDWFPIWIQGCEVELSGIAGMFPCNTWFFLLFQEDQYQCWWHRCILYYLKRWDFWDNKKINWAGRKLSWSFKISMYFYFFLHVQTPRKTKNLVNLRIYDIYWNFGKIPSFTRRNQYEVVKRHQNLIHAPRFYLRIPILSVFQKQIENLDAKIESWCQDCMLTPTIPFYT